MGGTQNKEPREEVIIAQNGAGNSASTAVSEKEIHTVNSRYEIYLLFIITCILAATLYIIWRRCKAKYADFMRREILQQNPVEIRCGEPSSHSHPPQRVVI